VQHRAEADRREVNPPIRVETDMWSKAGTSPPEHGPAEAAQSGLPARAKWCRMWIVVVIVGDETHAALISRLEGRRVASPDI
jgi:hypothetical protein